MPQTQQKAGTHDLHAWRLAHDLSADQAAALLGTSRQVVYRWEQQSMAMSGPARQLFRLLQDPRILRLASDMPGAQEK